MRELLRGIKLEITWFLEDCRYNPDYHFAMVFWALVAAAVYFFGPLAVIVVGFYAVFLGFFGVIHGPLILYGTLQNWQSGMVSVPELMLGIAISVVLFAWGCLWIWGVNGGGPSSRDPYFR